jgi:GNAT superfamily N-acetyltransferase
VTQATISKIPKINPRNPSNPRNPVSIREAQNEDANSLAILLTQLGYPQKSSFVIRKLTELADCGSAKVFVAVRERTVVGFLSFDSEPAFHREGRIGTITAICVLEDYRGNGIGRQLIEHAEAYAKQTGCVRIAVASGMQRHETHRFYMNLGYEEKTKRFVKDF